MAEKTYFRPALYRFLEELAENNERSWFQDNKERYEEHVKDPALRFISDFGPRLRKISPHFVADPRPSGGSLFRIYRDVRFSKDKSPYKTHVGIQFRHAAGKDAHAPAFYLHLEPSRDFAAAGIWHPDGKTLGRIRDAIVADGARWRRVSGAKRLRELFDLGGDTLKRAPRGYDPEHPLIEDLKRKDFIAYTELGRRQVTAPGLPERLEALWKRTVPFVQFLCDAVGADF